MTPPRRKGQVLTAEQMLARNRNAQPSPEAAEQQQLPGICRFCGEKKEETATAPQSPCRKCRAVRNGLTNNAQRTRVASRRRASVAMTILTLSNATSQFYEGFFTHWFLRYIMDCHISTTYRRINALVDEGFLAIEKIIEGHTDRDGNLRTVRYRFQWTEQAIALTRREVDVARAADAAGIANADQTAILTMLTNAAPELVGEVQPEPEDIEAEEITPTWTSIRVRVKTHEHARLIEQAAPSLNAVLSRRAGRTVTVSPIPPPDDT